MRILLRPVAEMHVQPPWARVHVQDVRGDVKPRSGSTKTTQTGNVLRRASGREGRPAGAQGVMASMPAMRLRRVARWVAKRDKATSARLEDRYWAQRLVGLRVVRGYVMCSRAWGCRVLTGTWAACMYRLGTTRIFLLLDSGVVR